jgi:putative phosphoesterase
MRVLLLADVHANWEALLSLQRAEPQPEAILFAGDAVGYGPDPLNCVRWLRRHATLAVRGNHDHALVADAILGVPRELDEAAAESLDYARRMLSESDMAHLAAWPVSASIALGGAHFYLAHGTPRVPLTGQINPAMSTDAELRALFGEVAADVIVLGHTHVPSLRKFGGRLIVNPGSLGQPRYGAPDATYAVWEDGCVQIKHLHYDPGVTARKLRLTAISPGVVDQLGGILRSGLI